MKDKIYAFISEKTEGIVAMKIQGQNVPLVFQSKKLVKYVLPHMKEAVNQGGRIFLVEFSNPKILKTFD